MITVGLDFGTHQTKVCVERIDGTECEYSFIKFENECHEKFYTIPSIINVGENNRLSYGYLPKSAKGRLIRYFKQAAFRTSSANFLKHNDAMLFSCWYLTYILFELESRFGQNFSIQMGVPSDSSHFQKAQQTAVCILASAYRLVEDVFQNDKEKFLDTDMNTLVEKTEILPYSDKLKNEFGILVFPEAYACLKPLTSRGKIANGMNLMVDIGGGTTDISFFTIRDDKMNNIMVPQVYDFFSIDKGLNFLRDDKSQVGLSNPRLDVPNENDINIKKYEEYYDDISKICDNLYKRLHLECHKQSSLNGSTLDKALKNRPIIYCGGGSTYPTLRKIQFRGFNQIIHISDQQWDKKAVKDMDEIQMKNLCPILSTAYGLSIHTMDDKMECKPFKDIFEGIRQTKRTNNKSSNYDSHNRSVYEDWDALK